MNPLTTKAFAWLESFYASKGENYRDNPTASEKYRRTVRKKMVDDSVTAAPAQDMKTFYSFLTKDYKLASIIHCNAL